MKNRKMKNRYLIKIEKIMDWFVIGSLCVIGSLLLIVAGVSVYEIITEGYLLILISFILIVVGLGLVIDKFIIK